MARFKETTWKDFAGKMVKFNKLPFGTTIKLVNEEGKAIRSDKLIKRRPVRRNLMEEVPDNATVRAFLNQVAEYVSTDLAAKGYEVALFRPDGEIVSGGVKMGTVRKCTAAPAEGKRAHQRRQEEQIESIKATALNEIAEAEFEVNDPEVLVCAGYMRALIERYGNRSVRGFFTDL